MAEVEQFWFVCRRMASGLRNLTMKKIKARLADLGSTPLIGSPEGQEAGGRPCRMIFRSRNRRYHQGSTEHTSLREHYPKQVESPCLAPKSIRNCLRTSGLSLIGSTV